MKKKTFDLEVKDTITPRLSVLHDAKILQNHDVDYKELLNIEDASEYELHVDDDAVDYKKAGSYKAKVTVEDASHNKSEVFPYIFRKLRLMFLMHPMPCR